MARLESQILRHTALLTAARTYLRNNDLRIVIRLKERGLPVRRSHEGWKVFRKTDACSPPDRSGSFSRAVVLETLQTPEVSIVCPSGKRHIPKMRNADVAVIGAGIVGLAFAYAYAKRGKRVVLLERSDMAVGASVRNFGLVWPIGQKAGPVAERAMRSAALWQEVIDRARLWHSPTGSLHLAYADDEFAVLNEYLDSQTEKYGRQLLTPEQVRARSSYASIKGLVGGLWSPTERMVDSRQAIRAIPGMLREQFQVELCFGATVLEIDLPQIRTTDGTVWRVAEAVVCSGTDFETLYPGWFRASGLARCKLQMMRTTPVAGKILLEPALCSGLTLQHYDCFAECPSLPALRRRLQVELPFHCEHGIHVLISQTPRGEFTVGDSHTYGPTPEPFDREDIYVAILEYLQRFTNLPPSSIAERWHGVYAKRPGGTEWMVQPAEGVRVVTGLGGSGMTLAFGLAEEVVSGTYSER